MTDDMTKNEVPEKKSGGRNRRLWLRVLIFVLAAAVMLQFFSRLSCMSCQKVDADSSNMTRALWEEPENTIEVLAIGSSDLYSGISPLEWWQEYGYTGYVWAEAAQRFGETYAYLQAIYRHQTPEVVFIDMASAYRDQSVCDNLNSVAKGYAETLFPVFSYHRFWANPKRWSGLLDSVDNTTKGYLIRDEVAGVKSDEEDYMSASSDDTVSGTTAKILGKMVALCRKHGSAVILLNVPSASEWNTTKHDEIQQLADSLGVEYLDLNTEMSNQIDWSEDSADGGEHMNVYGAQKVTAFLGDYLSSRFDLTDYRSDASLSDEWNHDLESYRSALAARM